MHKFREKPSMIPKVCSNGSMFVRTLAAAVIFMCSIPDIHAQGETDEESGWSAVFSGYYRNLFMYQERGTYYDRRVLPEDRRMFSDMNRVMLSPEIRYGESFIFRTDAAFDAVFSNYNGSAVFDSYWVPDEYNRFTRPYVEVVNNEYIYSSAGIRNIYAKMVLGSFTLTAGRQQLRFGSSRLWNPLDLLCSFSPMLVDGADEPHGTDALRVDWYPFESAELTAVVNPVRENDSTGDMSWRSSNYLLRFMAGTGDLDLALLGGYTAKRKNYGFDMQYVVSDGMLTAVVLWSGPDEERSFYQCGAGYEYTFASGIYLLAEYFYNSLPVNGDDELAAALARMAFSGIDSSNYYILANRIITFNTHYFSAAAGYSIHPLLRSELFAIWDIQGAGVFINGSLKFNSSDNSDISAGIIWAYAGSDDRISDFEAYSKSPSFYASAVIYF